MKPPRKVHVNPYNVSLVFDADACNVGNVTGSWLADELKVILDPACAAGALRETVLHELIHALFTVTGLNRVYPDAGSESPGEDIIWRLTSRLLALLRDNPKLVAYLTEEDR